MFHQFNSNVIPVPNLVGKTHFSLPLCFCRLPKPIERKSGLKTPSKPREFITKTTAEATENVTTTNLSDGEENRSE